MTAVVEAMVTASLEAGMTAAVEAAMMVKEKRLSPFVDDEKARRDVSRDEAIALERICRIGKQLQECVVVPGIEFIGGLVTHQLCEQLRIPAHAEGYHW